MAEFVLPKRKPGSEHKKSMSELLAQAQVKNKSRGETPEQRKFYNAGYDAGHQAGHKSGYKKGWEERGKIFVRKNTGGQK